MKKNTEFEFNPNWVDPMQNFSYEFPIMHWYTKKFNQFPQSYYIESGIYEGIEAYLLELNFENMHARYAETDKTLKPRKLEVIYIKNDVVIVLNFNGDEETRLVTFFFKSIDQVLEHVNEINKRKRVENEGKGRVYITRNEMELSLHQVRINNPLKTEELTLHYGKNFLTVHNKVKTVLDGEGAGFLLFYGKPGTGKTNYLRYLVNTSESTFIYIPSDFLRSISAPALTKFLLRNKQAIFIVEDAESVLISRNRNANSPVNMFLNITDGFLSDVFEFKFIVTLNSDVRKLDEALLRRGRLKIAHEFNLLDEVESNLLGDYLGVEKQFYGDNSLADIYNTEEVGLQDPSTQLGY